MEVEADLDDVIKFLKRIESGEEIETALKKLKPILENSLIDNVFHKSHSETLHIETKERLQSLISAGKGTHKPAAAEPGKDYNEEYLAKKEAYGEYYPHKFLDDGFYDDLNVDPKSDKIVMSVGHKLKRGFDYLKYHESQRSVLKASFLLAWEEMIKAIIKSFKESVE
jgi:hypothetical protein